MWRIRESALGAAARVPGLPATHPGWEDAAVPPARVGAYLRDFRALLARYGYRCALYGHFGDGCIHCHLDFDLRSEPGVARYLAFLDEAADLVVGYGGSLSGEHGDGQARAALLPKMFGDELVGAFRDFKRLWDPDGRMNPGKLVDAYRPDENLRAGPDYRPWTPKTRFRFAADGGSLAAAADRCVGVGKCRRSAGGTMCPSYMATGDEEHSTRGRARLLFELFSGDLLAGGWRDPHVRRALDLCLACKACRHECPVQVDMATYKAEFLSHFYRRRLRPRAAYSMGLVFWWARLASRAPRLVNFATGTRPLSTLVKAAAGIARERRIPRFAERPFTAWFRAREAARPPDAGDRRQRVVLWPDTFNNYLTPEVARAAVEVLEAAGFQVEIPSRPLCCGRPLYDWGMLGLASRLWRRTLETLKPAIDDGVPLVGLEPSCVAAFRDELINLFPDDADARRLSAQTRSLAELLADAGYRPPRLDRRALVHGHCHHHAVLGMEADRAVLDRLGLDFELLDSGCCGMAGAFGFEAAHYAISLQCGERVLLPRVRAAGEQTLIVADGFSCREQIAQATGRRALHLAEVIRLAQD